MKLSAIVITKNEAAAITRCLNSVAFADERIVVDSGSTDNTTALATAAGATVFHHDWEGYGAQKNYGALQAHGEWLLYVDADEELSPALAKAIQEVTTAPESDFYWLRIVTVFLNKPLSHLFGHNPRLFKKAAGHWTTAAVHEQVQTLDGSLVHLGDAISAVLPEALLHHSHDSIHSYLTSMHQYTTLDAQEMAKTHQHRSGRTVKASWLLPWQLAVRQTLKLLFYRAGILDGWQGVVWCILSGYYEFEMAQKYRTLCA